MAKTLKVITNLKELREKAEAYKTLTLKEREQFLKLFDDNTKNRILSESIKMDIEISSEDAERAKAFSEAYDEKAGRIGYLRHFNKKEAFEIIASYVKVNKFKDGFKIEKEYQAQYEQSLMDNVDAYENAEKRQKTP